MSHPFSPIVCDWCGMHKDIVNPQPEGNYHDHCYELKKRVKAEKLMAAVRKKPGILRGDRIVKPAHIRASRIHREISNADYQEQVAKSDEINARLVKKYGVPKYGKK